MTQSFFEKMNMHIDVNEKDYAEVSVDFDLSQSNHYGYYHGGVYFSIADHAAGLAAHSSGYSHVTANASIHYMIAVQNSKLTAKAKVISRSGKLCIVDVDIFDDQGQLVNKSTFTMYVIGGPNE